MNSLQADGTEVLNLPVEDFLLVYLSSVGGDYNPVAFYLSSLLINHKNHNRSPNGENLDLLKRFKYQLSLFVQLMVTSLLLTT